MISATAALAYYCARAKVRIRARMRAQGTITNTIHSPSEALQSPGGEGADGGIAQRKGSSHLGSAGCDEKACCSHQALTKAWCEPQAALPEPIHTTATHLRVSHMSCNCRGALNTTTPAASWIPRVLTPLRVSVTEGGRSMLLTSTRSEGALS